MLSSCFFGKIISISSADGITVFYHKKEEKISYILNELKKLVNVCEEEQRKLEDLTKIKKEQYEMEQRRLENDHPHLGQYENKDNMMKWSCCGKTKNTNLICGVLHVPKDCSLLDDALQRVQKECYITTIILGKGKHSNKNSKGELLSNWSVGLNNDLSIIGQTDLDKNDIILLSGIWIPEKNNPFRVHIQNVTIQSGVTTNAPFSLEDVIIENSKGLDRDDKLLYQFLTLQPPRRNDDINKLKIPHEIVFAIFGEFQGRGK